MALSRASGLARGPVRVTRTTPAPTGFSPTFPWDALRKVQLLAHRRKVQGLSLRGRAFHLTTPAVRDIGGASICIRLEEKDAAEGEAAHLVALREGGYLLGLQGPSAGVFLPAVAGVPCREGLDRSGQSRIGLAECMVFGRMGPAYLEVRLD
ncbi:unnamed protein product [Durusdinium trenchii]|uniref:Uncharacterized protein n=1 Tax=Durusdinium trenchii TaxID=1381693 RepID=A0ABP0MK70_9DINO